MAKAAIQIERTQIQSTAGTISFLRGKAQNNLQNAFVRVIFFLQYSTFGPLLLDELNCIRIGPSFDLTVDNYLTKIQIVCVFPPIVGVWLCMCLCEGIEFLFSKTRCMYNTCMYHAHTTTQTPSTQPHSIYACIAAYIWQLAKIHLKFVHLYLFLSSCIYIYTLLLSAKCRKKGEENLYVYHIVWFSHTPSESFLSTRIHRIKKKKKFGKIHMILWWIRTKYSIETKVIQIIKSEYSEFWTRADITNFMHWCLKKIILKLLSFGSIIVRLFYFALWRKKITAFLR